MTLGEQNERLAKRVVKMTFELNMLKELLPKEKVQEVERRIAELSKDTSDVSEGLIEP